MTTSVQKASKKDLLQVSKRKIIKMAEYRIGTQPPVIIKHTVSAYNGEKRSPFY
jgi:hypothetical protein